MDTKALSVNNAPTLRLPFWPIGACILGVLAATSAYSYLLFHTLAELFSVVIAGGVFVVAWNTRSYLTGSPLIYIGTGYLTVGLIDLFHTISYAGMGVFPGGHFYANQLWIVARLLEAVTILLFLSIFPRRSKTADFLVAFGYPLAAAAALFTIFVVPVFPACYIAGQGQTTFKIASEYVIIAILLAAFILVSSKLSFSSGTRSLIRWSIALTAVEELLFTTYTSNYGITNLVGHLVKIVSFYFIYKAVIETNLRRPYETTFRQLVDHQHALEAANALKDRFLSIIGHDLRNPLGGIAEMSRLILTDESTLESVSPREVMSHIYRSASQSLELLNNLLSWARSHGDDLVVEAEDFSLSEVLQSTLALFSSATKNKQIEITMDAGSIFVHADRNMLTTVLRNLISNAVKFTPRGGSITVRATETDDDVTVQVIDTGVGITPEMEEQIFQPGGTPSSHGTEGESGTGLGLAVSKTFLEKNGGSLSVTSTAGSGSTFEFSVPRARADRNAPQELSRRNRSSGIISPRATGSDGSP